MSDNERLSLIDGKIIKGRQVKNDEEEDPPQKEENTHINDPVDENMLDSILLQCKRIGHGINVWREPK